MNRGGRSGASMAVLAALVASGFSGFGGVGFGTRSAGSAVTEARTIGVQKQAPSRLAEQARLMAQMFGPYRNGGPRRMPGRGWPVATDRRRAKKARNVARNRAAHR